MTKDQQIAQLRADLAASIAQTSRQIARAEKAELEWDRALALCDQRRDHLVKAIEERDKLQDQAGELASALERSRVLARGWRRLAETKAVEAGELRARLADLERVLAPILERGSWPHAQVGQMLVYADPSELRAVKAVLEKTKEPTDG